MIKLLEGRTELTEKKEEKKEVVYRTEEKGGKK